MAKIQSNKKNIKNTLSELEQKILFLDKPDWSKWLDYSDKGFTESDYSEMRSIMNRELSGENKFTKEEIWIPVHSWRALAQIKDVGMLEVFFEYLFCAGDNDDDYFAHDFIRKFSVHYGKSLIPLIKKEIDQDNVTDEDIYPHHVMMESLARIYIEYPSAIEARQILRGYLSKYKSNHPRINAMLIVSLLDIKDRDSLSDIMNCFGEDLVDQKMVCWSDVLRDFPDEDLPAEINPREDKSPHLMSSYRGDKNFSRILKQLGILIDLEKIKMFVLGTILAVEMVSPNDVMEEVLGFRDDGLLNKEGSKPNFYSTGHFKQFAYNFMALWNEMSRYQSEYYTMPPYDQSKVNELLNEINKKPSAGFFISLKLSHYGEILHFFLNGLDLGNTRSSKFLNDGGRVFYDFLKSKLKRIDEIDSSVQEPEKLLSYENELEQIYDDIFKMWEKEYFNFTASCRGTRLQEIERMKFLHENNDRGRNDLCPCGSGKKFKKCCMH